MSSFAKLSSPGLGTSNYSFYAIPVAWALALMPHAYAMALYDKERAPGTAEYDTTMPRKNISNVKDAKLSPVMADRFLRAEGSNDNSFTGLPLFAAAIVAGNMARLSPTTLNTAAALYLGLRGAYCLFYINGTTKLFANLRTASWLSASATCLTLFVWAGNKFRTGLGNVAF